MKIEIQGAVILKDGEQIATVDCSTVTSPAKLPPTVKEAIKKALGDEGLVFLIESNPVTPASLHFEWRKFNGEPVPPPLSDAELLALLQARGLAPHG